MVWKPDVLKEIQLEIPKPGRCYWSEFCLASPYWQRQKLSCCLQLESAPCNRLGGCTSDGWNAFTFCSHRQTRKCPAMPQGQSASKHYSALFPSALDSSMSPVFLIVAGAGQRQGGKQSSWRWEEHTQRCLQASVFFVLGSASVSPSSTHVLSLCGRVGLLARLGGVSIRWPFYSSTLTVSDWDQNHFQCKSRLQNKPSKYQISTLSRWDTSEEAHGLVLGPPSCPSQSKLFCDCDSKWGLG